MPDPTGAESRLAAARVVGSVFDQGQPLGRALELHVAALAASRDRALARRLASDVMRERPALEFMLNDLLKRPLPRHERLVHHLLLVGLAQLRSDAVPAHAAVHATVQAARLARRERYTGLLNGVLQNARRRAGGFVFDAERQPGLHYGYPDWLVETLRRDWPDRWRELLHAGNQPPPLWLRVNRRHGTRADYLQSLAEAGIQASPSPRLPDAVRLAHAVAVSTLPGFAQGAVSVQDAGAQLATALMALAPGQRVLDACAAPGGKSAHMLETADIELLSLDNDAERVTRLQDTLRRLQLDAEVGTADAVDPDAWWDGRPFDRILVDAPCSSTGVIRRHPDIRWLRRPDDLARYVSAQRALVSALWPLVKPGGMLVYATCSVLQQENAAQGAHFLATLDDAEHHPFQAMPGHNAAPGTQLLPGDEDMDGFYYLGLARRLR